jgi:hypothetical protein
MKPKTIAAARAKCNNVLRRLLHSNARIPWPFLIALIPIVLSLLFIATFYGLHILLHLDKFRELEIKPIPKNLQLIQELRARMFWGLSILALLMALIWNIGLSAQILFKAFYGASKRIKLFVFAMSLITPIALTIAVTIRSFGGGAGNFLIKSVYENSSRLIPVQQIIQACNALACLAVFLIAATCSYLIYLPSIHHEKAVQIVSEKLNDAKASLFSSSAFLVLGVAEIHFLFAWPLSFADIQTKPNLIILTHTLSASAGALYTVLLASLYLPVATTHNRWIRQLWQDASKADQSLNKERWLQQNSLDRSAFSDISQLAQVLAPSIAGIWIEKLF